MKQTCIKAKIKGEVQGVFFRDSTREQAQQLGVKGWVRNVEDGSVELLACGELDKMNRLIEWLHQGPTMANVTTVDYETIDADEADDLDDFQVIR